MCVCVPRITYCAITGSGRLKTHCGLDLGHPWFKDIRAKLPRFTFVKMYQIS